MTRLPLILGGVVFIAAAAAVLLDVGGIRSGGESRVSAVSVGGSAGSEARESRPQDEVAETYAESKIDAGEQVATQDTTGQDTGQDADAQAGDETVSATDEAAETDLAAKGYALGDIVIGDPNAKLTIYEYASLTCPHCASFHNDVLPTLKERYIDTGKVNLVVREVFFDEFGLYATAVARCGGESSYARYLNVFFKRQPEWSRGENADAIVGEIQRIGRQGGLPAEKIQACLSDQEFLSTLFEDSKVHIAEDQIEATPTFVIAGEKVRGARSVEEMSELLDAKLAE